MRWSRGVIACLLVGVGCGGGSGEATSSTVVDEEKPVTTEVSGRMSECPNRAEGSSSADVGDDGNYAVIITSLDLPSRSLSFDVVQWLVGQDAVDAYAIDEPGDPSGPPNDYWIRNENPLIRQAPVVDDAAVRLVQLSVDGSADVSDATLDDLADHLAGDAASTLFWITLDAGSVVELCEQYVP